MWQAAVSVPWRSGAFWVAGGPRNTWFWEAGFRGPQSGPGSGVQSLVTTQDSTRRANRLLSPETESPPPEGLHGRQQTPAERPGNEEGVGSRGSGGPPRGAGCRKERGRSQSAPRAREAWAAASPAANLGEAERRGWASSEAGGGGASRSPANGVATETRSPGVGQALTQLHCVFITRGSLDTDTCGRSHVSAGVPRPPAKGPPEREGSWGHTLPGASRGSPAPGTPPSGLGLLASRLRDDLTLSL